MSERSNNSELLKLFSYDPVPIKNASREKSEIYTKGGSSDLSESFDLGGSLSSGKLNGKLNGKIDELNDLRHVGKTEVFSLKSNDNYGNGSYHGSVKSSDNDMFIVNSENSKFEVHRGALKQNLKELRTQAHIPVHKLTPTYAEAFNSVQESIRILNNNPAMYEMALVDVREVFGDVAHVVRPGTVGAFFIGCATKDKFDGPLGCNPKCASSLTPNDPNFIGCHNMVLLYSDDDFVGLNHNKSTTAYIFVDHKFKGFTRNNITQLKDIGVEKVILVHGGANAEYKKVDKPVGVDQLPIRDCNNNDNDDSSSGSGAGVLFVILLIIVIIALLVILYRNNGY